jgi:hypothetical protein
MKRRGLRFCLVSLLVTASLAFVAISPAKSADPDGKKTDANERLSMASWIFREAMAHFEKGEQDRGEAKLAEIAGGYTDVVAAAPAMLLLASRARDRGDSKKEMEWLKRCAAFDKPVRTFRGLPEPMASRSEAVERLARLAERTRQWREALAWWTKWQPSSFCGTCLASMHRERVRNIYRCQRLAGDTAGALRFAWQRLGNASGPAAFFAAELWAAYEAAGQRQDL